MGTNIAMIRYNLGSIRHNFGFYFLGIFYEILRLAKPVF